jgi:hypothetical protein
MGIVYMGGERGGGGSRGRPFVEEKEGALCGAIYTGVVTPL